MGDRMPKPLPRMVPGRGRGLARLGFVVAVLWFGFWGVRGYNDYQDWLRGAAAQYFNFAEDAKWSYYRDWEYAVGLPLLILVAGLVGRWIYRGFKESD